jgi:pimeloyl-ACP methyl ester carboxylesterase
MDYRHGLKVVKQLIEDVDQKAALHLVPYSGHQVFLDNPAHFNEVLVRALLSN